jgi:hypothetical protein
VVLLLAQVRLVLVGVAQQLRVSVVSVQMLL